MSGKRLDNESFDDYRLRLRTEEKELKKRLKGKIFWPGEHGIYIKGDINEDK